MNAKTRRKSPLFGMVTAAALSLLLVGPAFAADGTTATVTGGSLTITNPLVADFGISSITGVDQDTTALLNEYSVSDLTGTGAGWHVTAVATQFTTGTDTLAAGSLVSEAWTVESLATESPDPTGIGAQTLDDGVVNIASAALDAGMGVYNFSDNLLTLALPADVFAGAYASTVTIDVVTAP